MKLKRTVLLVLLGLVLTTAGGCLYLRLQEVKKQLKDFDRNFEVVDQGDVTLRCRKPVLFSRDMKHLMALGPTAEQQTAEGKLWQYVYRKQYAKPKVEKGNYDIHIGMLFEKDKLRELRFSERFLMILPKNRLIAAFRAVGRAKIDKKSRRLSSELKEEKTSQEQPLSITRRDVLKRLGEPLVSATDAAAGTSTLSYLYDLEKPASDRIDKKGKKRKTKKVTNWVKFTFVGANHWLAKADMQFGSLKISLKFPVPPPRPTK